MLKSCTFSPVEDTSQYIVKCVTSSRKFVDTGEKALELSFDVHFNGAEVKFNFSGMLSHSVDGGLVQFDMFMNGVSLTHKYGVCTQFFDFSKRLYSVKFSTFSIPLGIGSYTLKLYWKTNRGSVTLYEGANIAADISYSWGF